MSYLTVERGGRCWDHVAMKDRNGNIAFKKYFNMTYDEMKSCEDLDEFVVAIMEATNKEVNGLDDQTAIVLVGDDDIFIWGIIIGAGDNDGDLKYVLIDWKKDGKNYRYEPEKTS